MYKILITGISACFLLSACAASNIANKPEKGLSYIGGSRPAAAPIGLIIYCRDNPDDCRQAAPQSVAPSPVLATATEAASAAVPMLIAANAEASPLCPAEVTCVSELQSLSVTLMPTASAAPAMSSTHAFDDEVAQAMEFALIESVMTRMSAPREPARITPAWSRRPVGLSASDLARVNDSINAAIAPATDWEIYGVGERWARPLKTMGDRARGNCKDYAMEKRARLLDLGVSPDSLALALVDAPGFGRHVVLIVATATGDVVLDNLVRDIRPVDRTDYRWLAVQANADLLKWTAADLWRQPLATASTPSAAADFTGA